MQRKTVNLGRIFRRVTGKKRKKKGAYTIDWNWRTKKRRQAKLRRAALVLCVLLVLIGGVSLATRKPKNSASDTDSETTEKSVAAGTVTSKVWTRDEEGEITSLVQQYYEALLANDTETLSLVLDESVVLDEEQVAGQSDFIEAYEDFVVYTADGAEKMSTLFIFPAPCSLPGLRQRCRN
ncbi:MAG: hypothetical protein LUF34_12075 [Lachnospiraceae bacterium]|nr:hypothetical protein [Lachnospiraceae bacterium]